MKKIDREALHRCVDEFCRDPARARQLEAHKERGDSWEERATFACYGVQMKNMQLPPWGCPPCWSDGAPLESSAFAVEQIKAMVFADRLRANGLSIYEPDPIAALQQVAEAKQRELHLVEPPPSVAQGETK